MVRIFAVDFASGFLIHILQPMSYCAHQSRRTAYQRCRILRENICRRQPEAEQVRTLESNIWINAVDSLGVGSWPSPCAWCMKSVLCHHIHHESRACHQRKSFQICQEIRGGRRYKWTSSSTWVRIHSFDYGCNLRILIREFTKLCR